MPPRLRVALALLALGVVAVLATLAGERRTRRPAADPRLSTFVYGPAGASGWADGLDRLGVSVERVRDVGRLTDTAVADRDALVAILQPDVPLDLFDGDALARHVAAGGSVLLAGEATTEAMRCLGYAVVPRGRDSLRAAAPRRVPGADAPWVHATLRPTGRSQVVDTLEAASGVVAECSVPTLTRIDTLLTVAGGRPVALELTGPAGGRALLVADGTLFSNRRLRATAAGPFALGVVAGRYERVLVDEARHGYGTGGNLAGALLGWSVASPWGWVVWQLALVGVLGLVAAGVRFGPPRPLEERRRRSPLEHVHALATALAAARGHDVAIGLLVHGLRRRLARAGAPLRGDARGWLEGLMPHLRTPRAQAAAASLIALSHPPQPAAAVLRAAHAVEDLWEELRP